jgi:hypothetical protein
MRIVHGMENNCFKVKIWSKGRVSYAKLDGTDIYHSTEPGIQCKVGQDQ